MWQTVHYREKLSSHVLRERSPELIQNSRGKATKDACGRVSAQDCPIMLGCKGQIACFFLEAPCKKQRALLA